MQRNRNVLYRVAEEKEDTVTEIFVNLMRWKFVRDIFLKRIVDKESLDSIQFRHISTQVTISNRKRPDIVIENEKLIVIIENKIYDKTIMQNSQMEGGEYCNYLMDRKQPVKLLIYLVPEKYEIPGANTSDKKISINTVIWKDVIDDIMTSEIYDANLCIKENVDFILSALNLTASKKSFTIKESLFMYDKFTLTNVCSLFIKTKSYTQEVMEKFKNKYQKQFSLSKVEFEMKEYNWGTWLISTVNNEWPFFLGYSFSYNDDQENAFLFNFKIHNTLFNHINDGVLSKENEKNTWFNNGSWYVISVPKSILSSDKNVPDELFNFIDGLIKKPE